MSPFMGSHVSIYHKPDRLVLGCHGDIALTVYWQPHALCHVTYIMCLFDRTVLFSIYSVAPCSC